VFEKSLRASPVRYCLFSIFDVDSFENTPFFLKRGRIVFKTWRYLCRTLYVCKDSDQSFFPFIHVDVKETDVFHRGLDYFIVFITAHLQTPVLN